MSQWAIKPHEWTDDEVDLDIVEESALATAQSTIQNAISRSGISRSEMARRMKRDRSFISRMMNGGHNLTIKTMAKSLAVCGFEVRFQTIPLQWNWVDIPCQKAEEEVPAANAGTSMLSKDLNLNMPVPAPAS